MKNEKEFYVDGNIITNNLEINIMKSSTLGRPITRLALVTSLFLFVAADGAFATVIFQDGFESGNFATSTNGFTWQLRNTESDPAISTGQSKSGTRSVLFPFQADNSAFMCSPANGSCNDSWKELRFALGGRYSEFWMKFDIYIPTNYTHRGDLPNNNKFMYLDNDVHTLFVGFESWQTLQNTGSSAGGPGSDYLPLHLKYNSVDYGHDQPGNNYFGQTSDPANYVNTASDLGRWHEWIIHVKLASGASTKDGVVQMWKNGVKEMEYLSLNNYTPGSNYISQGYLQGWANAGYVQQTNVYIDNFIVSSDPIASGGASGAGTPAMPSGLSVKKP